MTTRQKILRIASITFLSLYFLYLGASNYLLHGERVLKFFMDPNDSLKIHYQSAQSLFPGLVHVRNLSIGDTNSAEDWKFVTTETWVLINLFALPFKRFHSPWSSASDVNFGLHFHPSLKTAEKINANTTTPDWSIEVPLIHFHKMKALEIQDFKVAGDFDMNAGFILWPKKKPIENAIEIRRSNFFFKNAELLLKGSSVFSQLQGQLVSHLDPFNPDEEDAMKILAGLDVDASLRGQIDNPIFLKAYLKEASWITSDQSQGEANVRIKIERGKLLPPTHLRAELKSIDLKIFDHLIRGQGDLDFRVSDRSALEIKFPHYEVTDFKSLAVLGSGENFLLKVNTAQTALSPEFKNLDIELDAPSAVIPNIKAYQFYFPKSLNLIPLEGKGSLSLHLKAATNRTDEPGEVKIHFDRAKFRFQNTFILGDLDFGLKLHSTDLSKRDFELEGSTLQISNLVMSDHNISKDQIIDKKKSWWASVVLSKSRLFLNQPLQFLSHLQIKLKNSEPILKLYSKIQKIPYLAKYLLQMKDIQATADLHFGDEFQDWQNLDFKSDEVVAKGRMRQIKDNTYGVFLITKSSFKIGLSVKASKLDFKLIGAEKWFKKYEAFPMIPDSAFNPSFNWASQLEKPSSSQSPPHD